jgi:hypothetical protein
MMLMMEEEKRSFIDFSYNVLHNFPSCLIQKNSVRKNRFGKEIVKLHGSTVAEFPSSYCLDLVGLLERFKVV